MRKCNGNKQTLREGGTEGTAGEAEAKLVQVGLQVMLGQTVVGSQNKSLGVAEYNVQPMKHTGTRVISTVFMVIAFQRGDVAAVTVALDHAIIREALLRKLLILIFNKNKIKSRSER